MTSVQRLNIITGKIWYHLASFVSAGKLDMVFWAYCKGRKIWIPAPIARGYMQLMARRDEEDQGKLGSATSETGWELTMLLQFERHKIVINGGQWSPKSLMDMEPVIDWLMLPQINVTSIYIYVCTKQKLLWICSLCCIYNVYCQHRPPSFFLTKVLYNKSL